MIIFGVVNPKESSGKSALELLYEFFASTDRRRTEPTK